MSGIRSIYRGPTIKGYASGGSAPVYVDSDDNLVKVIVAGSGTTEKTLVDTNSTQTLTNKTISLPASITDDSVFGIGTDSDTVLYNRSTSNLADAEITNVIVGTSDIPALAANSFILSNITADGDILVAAQTGGNSTGYIFIDASASAMYFYSAGVETAIVGAVGVTVADDKLLRVGTTGDGVLVNNTAGNTGDAALANVLIGTPVTSTTAANSLLISNVTAAGDIGLYANRGGNSEEYLFVDASAGVLYLSGLAGGISLALATDQPAPDGNGVHIWDGTAGAVTAVAASRLIIETDQATNAISLLGPTTTTAQGLYFGDTDNDAGSLLYSHASVETLNVTVATVAVGKWNNAGYHNIAGLLTDKRTDASVSTDSNQVYTAAQVLGGVITRTGQTAGRTDAIDTAANIVAAIPGAYVGQCFFFVVNNNDASDTVTVNGASTGITYEGTATALAIGDAWLFMGMITNVTGAAEAVTIYQFAK